MSTIILKDGRKLGYAEFGEPHGMPVFFFHGIPGSRLYHPPNNITKRMSVRLISVERPGYGISSFKPGRRILDWPDDVVQLADALAIDTFAIAGHSGGGPYTSACAYKIPERITATAILCGLGPLDNAEATHGMSTINRLGLTFGRYIPWPLWMSLNWFFYHKGYNDPAAVMERDADRRPAADAALWEKPEIRQVCYASTSEGLRQGTRGLAWDTRLICRPWGFHLNEISMPVYLWHGTADNLTPVSMARFVASKIPNCQATFCENEGHLALFNHWADILEQLVK